MFSKYFDYNKFIVGLLVLLLVSSVVACTGDQEVEQSKESVSNTRVITDMAGRKVEIPQEINSVYPAFMIPNVALYTINPSKMCGRMGYLTDLNYTTEEFKELPVVGNYMHGKDANEEQILELNPDFILYMGIISDSLIQEANRNQARLGIPIVFVDGRLKNLPQSYRFLGKLLSEKEKANQLAKYCQETINQAQEIASSIPEAKCKKVYYALGNDGLTTNGPDSIHAEIIGLVGGVNAAQLKGKKTYSRSDVSIEQLLNWNPDTIVVHKSSFKKHGEVNLYFQILESDKWSGIEAVKSKEVYEIPCRPFIWYDKPPSVNRILGIKWLGNLLYPEKFDLDMRAETKEFYQKFYHYDLTDEDLDKIMRNAVKKNK